MAPLTPWVDHVPPPSAYRHRRLRCFCMDIRFESPKVCIKQRLWPKAFGFHVLGEAASLRGSSSTRRVPVCEPRASALRKCKCNPRQGQCFCLHSGMAIPPDSEAGFGFVSSGTPSGLQLQGL